MSLLDAYEMGRYVTRYRWVPGHWRVSDYIDATARMTERQRDAYFLGRDRFARLGEY